MSFLGFLFSFIGDFSASDYGVFLSVLSSSLYRVPGGGGGAYYYIFVCILSEGTLLILITVEYQVYWAARYILYSTCHLSLLQSSV